MTDQPAAAPAPEPEQIQWLFHNGQPISAEKAGELRADLMADKEFVKAALAGDKAKLKEMADLLRLSRGEQPGNDLPPAPPPQDELGVLSQQERREVEINELRIDAHASVGINEEQSFQILGGRPVTFEERQFHEEQIARLRTDQDFMRRWSRGDRAAITEMAVHASARAMPIGTVEQCEAWDREYMLRFRGA